MMGLDSMLKTKFSNNLQNPSTFVAIVQDQCGNLQSNNADECFIDSSTRLDFDGMHDDKFTWRSEDPWLVSPP